ncbi:hypothetical protein BSKO_13337 [Bryopsis sp. KO-2023]|nr:hypothetical protein BSKO_13337 [Bryopsis sp. KO-2023]
MADRASLSVRCCTQGLPLVDALNKRARRRFEVPLHVPGHKRGRGAGNELVNLIGDKALSCDATELKGLDNLSNPNGVIEEAQMLARETFGSEKTWFLVNGCTVGVQASIMATCAENSVCILARNCHVSAFSGLVLSGCRPVYVLPEHDVGNGIAHCVTVKAVQEALENATKKKLKVGAVVIVSPTYFGAVANVRDLADLCHSYDVPLIVDEAHGGHFKFHEGFPAAAIDCGADIVIQSTHKSLTSMTQSAMLHLKSDRVSPQKITKLLRLLQTSSPSYLLMASLDAARKQCQNPKLFSKPLHAAETARKMLRKLPEVRLLEDGIVDAYKGVHAYDPLRICLCMEALPMSGFELYDALEDQHGIVGEFATEQLVNFIFGPGSGLDDGIALGTALASCLNNLNSDEIKRSQNSQHQKSGPWLPEVELTPKEAFYSASERVPLVESIGRLSAESICPYPPGIPMVCPGERITKKLIEALQVAQVSTITGAQDPTLRTILVVCHG